MVDSIQHVVEQGEYLVQLATRYGFDADAVWNSAENKSLRDQGRDPNILHPGDILYVPPTQKTWLPGKVGVANTFTATIPLVTVSFSLSHHGEALAGEPYVVFGAPIPAGALDATGTFTAKVRTTVKQFVLRLTKRNENHVVHVGHLDPIEKPSGVFTRLAALGFGGEGATHRHAATGELELALRAFQRANKLDVTGRMNDATKKQLLEAYGR